jgi:hypothetical protein
VNSFRKRLIRNLRLLPRVAPADLGHFLSDRVSKVVVRAFGVPAYRLSVRLRRPLLPVLRKRHGVLSHATRVYRPGLYEGRITLIRTHRFAGREDATPTLGWERVAGGGVDVRWVAGQHLTLMQEPFVGELAAELQGCIDQVLQDGNCGPTPD